MEKESEIEREFAFHLGKTGNARTVDSYLRVVRRFLRYAHEGNLDLLDADTVRGFFKQLAGGKQNKTEVAMIITKFLKLVQARASLPVAAKHRAELTTLKKNWDVEKAADRKEAADDTLALLGRKLINHFLYFQRRLDGEPESIEELSRMAEECQDLLKSNLALFLSLSAGGHNLGSVIDERTQQK